MKAKEKVNKHPGWRMTRGERLAYYTGDIGRQFCMALFTTFVGTFLLFQGIDVTSLAVVTLLLKIVDASDDVIFGFLVDRFNPKNVRLLRRIAGDGKYMPWYRVTFFVYPLITILFFSMPTNWPDAAKIAWYVVFYLLYDLTCTLNEVPMNSMVMTLTDHVGERNAILKTKGIIMTVSTIFLAIIWQFLISEYVGMSIKSVAIYSGIIFLISMIPLAVKVKEHNPELKNVEEDAQKEEKYSFKEMLLCLKTNKYILLFFLAQIIAGCLLTSTALSTFVSFYCYGSSMVSSLAMLIGFVPGCILMLSADKIAKKMGRRNALVFFNAIQGIGLLFVYIFGYNRIALSVAFSTIASIPATAKLLLNTFIAPDTIEYTRYKTGQDCSGIFYALNNFVSKITQSVAQSLGLFILGLAGWTAVEATDFADLAAQGVTQPQSAVSALWACHTVIPAIGCLLFAAIMLAYRLKDNDAELMAQCNAGQISREECESRLSRKY